MWVAGIPALAAGIANAANHVLQACMHVLQASLSSSQAPQTLQITGAGMPARLGFKILYAETRGEQDRGEERRGMSARAAQHCIHDMCPNGDGDVIQSDRCHRFVNGPERVWWSNTLWCSLSIFCQQHNHSRHQNVLIHYF